jgi:hypothetical protein
MNLQTKSTAELRARKEQIGKPYTESIQRELEGIRAEIYRRAIEEAEQQSFPEPDDFMPAYSHHAETMERCALLW